VRFWKYEGLGNDFVVVEAPVDRAGAVTLCHRRLGVGADGVLAVLRPGGPADLAAEVSVVNADGSPAEICGNGLRCVALHLVEVHGVASPFRVGTGAGPLRCALLSHDGPGRATVEVEMGRPRLEREAVPAVGSGRMIEVPVEVAGRTLRLTAVGMGNPHAVVFDRVDPEEVPRLGPEIERHPLFPSRVNAGFAAVEAPDLIRLTVWERGAGLTSACGSGACAAAVAACITGRAEPGRGILVRQAGGDLTITVDPEDGPVLMRGPARRVFEGEIGLGEPTAPARRSAVPRRRTRQP
jgi:diaminopimelate epimerase